MTVRLLNIEQKEAITGKEYATDMRFNPIQDSDGNWVISEEEVEQCTEFEFVKDLPIIELKQKTEELLTVRP